MSKKRKKVTKQIANYWGFLVLFFGIAAFAMIFLNAVSDGEDLYYLGTDVVFGSSFTLLGQTTEFKFSILGFLAFFMPLFAGIAMVVPMKKNGGLVALVCALVFVISAILVFALPSYTKVYYDTFVGSGSYKIKGGLAVGTIISGICSIIAGFLALAKPFVKK